MIDLIEIHYRFCYFYKTNCLTDDRRRERNESLNPARLCLLKNLARVQIRCNCPMLISKLDILNSCIGVLKLISSCAAYLYQISRKFYLLEMVHISSASLKFLHQHVVVPNSLSARSLACLIFFVIIFLLLLFFRPGFLKICLYFVGSSQARARADLQLSLANSLCSIET